MLVIAIIILAVVLLALISKRKPAPATDDTPRQRDRAASDGMIFGETPGGVWEGGKLPDDVTPGGGDFGGGGSSSGWDSGDGGGE